MDKTIKPIPSVQTFDDWSDAYKVAAFKEESYMSDSNRNSDDPGCGCNDSGGELNNPYILDNADSIINYIPCT